MSIKLRYNISEWEKLNLNYWGITKCGNTSVKHALILSSNTNIRDKRRDPHGSQAWIHSENNLKYIDVKTALTNNYKNFSVVRDPLERFKSMYKDVLRRHNHFFGRSNFSIKTMDDLLDYIERTPDDVREVHFRSQTFYISDGNKLLPDDVIDINDIDRIESITGRKIEHINAINNDIDVSEKQRQRVYDLYSNDYRLLEYSR